MAFLTKLSYTVKLPNGKRETRKCQHWTIQYRDADGKIKRVKGYTDKAATKKMASDLETARARGEQGLVNPFKAPLARAIDEHVTEYVDSLRAAGCSEMYAYTAKQRLQRIIDEAGWESLKDITADSFIRWRDAAKKKPRTVGFRKAKEGKATASATTLNQYLDIARAFTNWCATVSRMPGIPAAGGKMMATALAGVGKVDGEKRRKRRALSDEEVTRLLAVAPADRAVVYRFGVTTGLRRSELEELRWGDLRLNATKPYIQLRAEATKAGRADPVPLAPGLADELRKIKPGDVADGDRVFPDVPSMYFWQQDLKAAGIKYLDSMGRQADFHGGTRKTLCTRMHRNNVPLAVAMRIMRHTDAKLTMVDYADDQLLGTATAVESMPELVAPAKPQGAAAAG